MTSFFHGVAPSEEPCTVWFARLRLLSETDKSGSKDVKGDDRVVDDVAASCFHCLPGGAVYVGELKVVPVTGARSFDLLIAFDFSVGEGLLQNALFSIARRSRCSLVTSCGPAEGEGVAKFLQRHLEAFESKGSDAYIRFTEFVSRIMDVVEQCKAHAKDQLGWVFADDRHDETALLEHLRRVRLAWLQLMVELMAYRDFKASCRRR